MAAQVKLMDYLGQFSPDEVAETFPLDAGSAAYKYLWDEVIPRAGGAEQTEDGPVGCPKTMRQMWKPIPKAIKAEIKKAARQQIAEKFPKPGKVKKAKKEPVPEPVVEVKQAVFPLTPERMETMRKAVVSVYQQIAGDLPEGMKAAEIIEVACDADRLATFGHNVADALLKQIVKGGAYDRFMKRAAKEWNL